MGNVKQQSVSQWMNKGRHPASYSPGWHHVLDGGPDLPMERGNFEQKGMPWHAW